jgi:endogenous inhibitor of DNA gyrase (YacG/DUF329 family)
MSKERIKLICPTCKKEFFVHKYREKTAKFCSRLCFRQLNKQPTTKIKTICIACGKEFLSYKNRKQKFCSRICQYKYPKSQETIKKMSIVKIGKSTWNKGKHYSKEHCKNISKSLSGHKLTQKTIEKMMGRTPWNKGKSTKIETYCEICGAKILAYKSRKRKFCSYSCFLKKPIKFGENNPSWKGGKSFEPYGIEFNKKLKEKIRKRDRYTCQECGETQQESHRKLSIHHIDFNKTNNKENNLISLCGHCHSKTQYDRENWTQYYQKKLISKLKDLSSAHGI